MSAVPIRRGWLTAGAYAAGVAVLLAFRGRGRLVSPATVGAALAAADALAVLYGTAGVFAISSAIAIRPIARAR